VSSGRLGAPFGTRIDRTRKVGFQFNGRDYQGFQGDTLASALLANDVRLVGRSFKLHRPRGIFSCGVEEPTGLVDVGEGARRTPNLRATLVEVHEGLVAASVNCWPSVGFDVGAVNDWLSAMLPAGFYYKTFMWPDWHLFEPWIRRAAGLGRASGLPDPDHYEEISAVADVLVVGAGLAGLSCAVAAAAAGASTVLLASSATLGGRLEWRADPRILALVAEARRLDVRILTRTLAFGVFDHNLLCAVESLSSITAGAQRPQGVLRERLWKIRARHIVAANGAFERPMVFPDNDRPGVMLAAAAEKYAYGYGVACGRRVVIASNCDSAYAVASSLRAAGVEIAALVERRPPSDVAAAADGLRVISEAAIASVAGTRAVHGCTVVSVAGGTRPEKIECDLILSAGGYAPAVHLHSQAGGKLRWLDDSAMFVPMARRPGSSASVLAPVCSRRPTRPVMRPSLAGRSPGEAPCRPCPWAASVARSRAPTCRV